MKTGRIIAIACYNCQGKGHIARHCRKPRKLLGKPGFIKERNGVAITRELIKCRLEMKTGRITMILLVIIAKEKCT
jgi:hypothetical protein